MAMGARTAQIGMTDLKLHFVFTTLFSGETWCLNPDFHRLSGGNDDRRAPFLKPQKYCLFLCVRSQTAQFTCHRLSGKHQITCHGFGLKHHITCHGLGLRVGSHPHSNASAPEIITQNIRSDDAVDQSPNLVIARCTEKCTFRRLVSDDHEMPIRWFSGTAMRLRAQPVTFSS
jgi:hypothetical protein